MSVNLPNIYGQQFALIIQLLLQQKDSRLRGRVSSNTYKGKQAQVVDQFAPIAMQPVTGRFAPIGRVDAAATARWVTPNDFELNQLIDSFDRLKLLVDPQSSYVLNAHHAANRTIDDIIIASFYASSLTGETGSTLVALPAGQQVAVTQGAASNTNLTVAKLRAARKLLRAAEVDLDADPVTVVVSAAQEDSLMQEAQMIDLDYTDMPVLVEGRIHRFMGMEFVHSERLPLDGTGYRRVPVFAKSGMHVGIWEDVQTNVSRREDLSGLPWQAYVMLSVGATRLEEKKFVEIKCDEAAS